MFDGRAVGSVGVVVEHNSSVSPITSPAVPAPRETRHYTEREAYAKTNAGSRRVEPAPTDCGLLSERIGS